MAKTTPEAESENQPGKARTWWHPLLVRMIDWTLEGAYEVRGEVNVGRMPLRVDIVLIKRGDGNLPELARRQLPAVAERLNRYTLIEFKSPSDALELGDLDYLLGCTHQFRAQQLESLHCREITLIVLAPTLNKSFREELDRNDWNSEEESSGIHRIDGPTFTTWMIETDKFSGLDEPILTLCSRVFLRDPQRIIESLKQGGHSRLLQYVIQQLTQFRHAGKEFTMQHADTETMDATYEELRSQLIAESSPEELLRVLTPEQRLCGLSPEDVIQGFDSDQLAKLRELLRSIESTDQSKHE